MPIPARRERVVAYSLRGRPRKKLYRRALQHAGWSSQTARLDQCDAIGFEALAAIDHIDAHALARAERLHAAATQRRDVHKDVFSSSIRRNEAVPLIRLEPLDGPFQGLCRAARRARSGGASTPAATARGCRAVVDVEDADDERAFGAGTKLAGDGCAFADIVVTGAAQDGHRQESIRTAVRHRYESKTLRRVEPLHLGLDAATRLRLITPEITRTPIIVHGASARRI